MPYKLIIADDEDYIRNGLKDLIPWADYGFSVEAVFADGKKLIDYIQDNEVHVVLSDIRMDNVTGLDVAKYIYEKRLPIKVVLISAYQDFTYAQNAVNYNVANFLSKPTRPSEVKEVFLRLREELDKVEAAAKFEMDMKENNEKIEALLTRQLFSDLFFGAIKDAGELKKRLELLNLKIDPEKKGCFVFSICIDENLVNQQQLFDIYNFIIFTKLYAQNKNLGNFSFYPLYRNSRRITFIALEVASDVSNSNEDDITNIQSHLQNLLSQIQKLFNVKLYMKLHNSYKNLIEYMKNGSSDMSSHMDGNVNSTTEALDIIDGHIKKLIASIRSNEDNVALNVMENICQIGNGSILFLRAVTYTVINELSELRKENYLIDKNLLNKIRNCTQAKDLVDIVYDLMRYSKASNDIKFSNSCDIVRIAQNYIKENYSSDVYLDIVAEHINVSPSYLSRIFKKITGTNFTQYIIDIRMEKALEFLKDSDLKVYEISEMVGYKNTFYFFRIFKNKYGYTPLDYRNLKKG